MYNFEQANKIILLFQKVKTHTLFCKDKRELIITFNNGYKVIFCTS